MAAGFGARTIYKMGWKEYYEDRKITAEEAVQKIPSDSVVVLAHAAGEPGYLVDAMVENAEQYHNVRIMHMVSLGKAAYCQEGMEKHFIHDSLFVSGQTRDAIAAGRADFTPCFFYKVPELFEKSVKVDVAMVMVTPPDENGRVSLGVSCDYTLPALREAKLVIAQVNREMPWAEGETVIPVEDIDCFVEHDALIPELKPAKIGEVEKAIGKNCAELIHDGDTLQLGIGAIPDAVLAELGDKKDLGIHSEMFSDGVVDLVKKGVINNTRKSLRPGKLVVTFLMGTKKLYDFVDHNPDIYMAPVDYVNNPVVVSQNDNIVCINSCVQIDLQGQVCSEAIGPKQISAAGGQVDFVRGASMARNGISIMAMSSTAAHGKVSKIVANLDPGAPVTTSRYDVDYVVTEYGIAHLKGKNLRERAKALIRIAHPDFRKGLEEEFERRFAEPYVE
jgi:4-hydroxybutyrate CoA-transferase